MNDNSIMPWGKYKGKTMGELSEGYLQTLYDKGRLAGAMKLYAERRVPILRFEAGKKQNEDRSIYQRGAPELNTH